MKQEQVIDILQQLGFTLEDISESGFGFRFEFEGLTILFSPEEDSETLTLIAPNVFEFNEENRNMVLEKMAQLTGAIKFLQPTIMFENSVWITYTHYLGETEPTMNLLEHMIRALGIGTCKFHEFINEDGAEYETTNE